MKFGRSATQSGARRPEFQAEEHSASVFELELCASLFSMSNILVIRITLRVMPSSCLLLAKLTAHCSFALICDYLLLLTCARDLYARARKIVYAFCPLAGKKPRKRRVYIIYYISVFYL